MHPDLNTAILIIGFIAAIWRTERLDDKLSSRIDRLADKLDAINRTLGEHTADIKNLKDAHGQQVIHG
jgi:hypothetical protein